MNLDAKKHVTSTMNFMVNPKFWAKVGSAKGKNICLQSTVSEKHLHMIMNLKWLC